jgi:2-polyprenyl-3-methyl-5-hydroxy-6-metoxy-1,4-benzoquinol methylase
MMQREKTPCLICNKNNEKFLFKKDEFSIVKCKNCGLVYVNPRLTEKEIIKLYNDESISPLQYYEDNKKGDEISFKKRLKLIEELYKRKGKILDIGCNIGTFLKVAKDSGWDCYGIDVNKGVEKECKKLGINFKARKLEKRSYKKEFFDVIIMNDVIEHLHHPKEFLAMVKNIVKKEGLIFVVTPNVASLTAKVLKKKWHHLKPNEHLVYFSKKTIKKLMEDQGFQIIKMKNISRWRKIDTIITKSGSLSWFIPSIKKIIPKKITEFVIPFNTFDEVCIIVKKIG